MNSFMGDWGRSPSCMDQKDVQLQGLGETISLDIRPNSMTATSYL